jgi:hypothetical protein
MKVLCNIHKRSRSFFSSAGRTKSSKLVGYKKGFYYADTLEFSYENGCVFFETNEGLVQVKQNDVLILPDVEICFQIKENDVKQKLRWEPSPLSHPITGTSNNDPLDFLFKGNAIKLLS